MADGINIKAIQTDKFKTVCIAVLLRQNLDREYATYNAMLPMILAMGCEKYKDITEINIKTDELFGVTFFTDILKKGEYQMIEILVQYTEKNINLDEIFSFLHDIILKPCVENGGFLQKYFDKAKNMLIENINDKMSDKKSFAKDRCIEIMCEKENFGVSADGYIEDLKGDKINRKTLYNHYKKVLLTGDIDIIAIGNIDEKDVKKCAKKYFDIDRKYLPEKQNKYNIEKSKAKFITEKFKITQGKLCLGYRTGIFAKDDNFHALLVANEILGGGAGSLLFNNIREKKSLCYYINSMIFMFKGILFVQSGINFKDYENVINGIEKEIENIKNGKFSEKNMENAITNLCKKYVGSLDYNMSTMDYYVARNLAKIDDNILETIEKIKKVKKENVVESVQNIWLDTCYFMKGDES